MKRIVELVNEWATFEEQFSDASIEDFCRYYLIRKRESESKEFLYDGIVPPDTNTSLSKLLGRIGGVINIYARLAIQKTELKRMEEFLFLNVIKWNKEMRKTDAINYNMLELSTGIDILNRMVEDQLITERVDDNDKRSKLLKVTNKGEQMLFQCYRQLSKMSDVLFNDLPEDDKKLCIQLLKGIEIKHSKQVIEYKNKDLDKVYEEYLRTKPANR